MLMQARLEIVDVVLVELEVVIETREHSVTLHVLFCSSPILPAASFGRMITEYRPILRGFSVIVPVVPLSVWILVSQFVMS
jgi:hypothetical protein